MDIFWNHTFTKNTSYGYKVLKLKKGSNNITDWINITQRKNNTADGNS